MSPFHAGWALKFTVAPCLYPYSIHLFTDYPAPGTLYERGKMRELTWTYSTRQATWDPDRYVEVKLDYAGPYRFQYTKEGEDGQEGSGYFLVEPDLGYSPEGICCQTYITKLMGSFGEWKDRLTVGREAGYNMFHFTPVQQLGSSRSAYSISNHLRMDSIYFHSGHTFSETTVTYTDATGTACQLQVDSTFIKLRDLVKELNRDWGVLSIIDVVWNHTAFDTPWLMQHPEVGYNLVNSPHLRPAYALDVTLSDFSRDVAEGKWIRPEVENEGDIHNICSRLLESVLPEARLWEYSSVDVEAVVDEFRTAVYRLNGGSHPRPEGKRLTIVQDKSYRRLCSTVDMDMALELFNIDW
jgi:glycogen debranching enzyme